MTISLSKKIGFLIAVGVIFFAGIFAFIFLSKNSLPETSARYAFISTGQTEISTTSFYFNAACDNISPCNDFTLYNGATFLLNISNFIDSEFMDENIDYQISISDGNGPHDDYNLIIDGITYYDDTALMSISGGSARTESMRIVLDKTNQSPNRNVYFTIQTTAPYVKTISFRVYEDTQFLSYTVTGNATDWTNQDVTLTIVPDATNIAAYSFDNGNTWQTSPSKTFSSNQSVNIKIKNIYGMTSGTPSPVTINKIDKTPPTIINTSGDKAIMTIGDSAKQLSSYFYVTDNQSGVASNLPTKITRMNGATVTTTNDFSSVGWYKLTATATDRAGNTATFDSSLMIRPPTGGHYILFKQPIAGTGKNTGGSTSGLFRDNSDTGLDVNCAFCSQYYYTGPSVNNYFSFAGSNNFRILNIPTNYDLKIIGGASSKTQAWSDDEIYGTSQYSTWQTWWNNRYIYYDSDDSARLSFSATDASHISDATFFAGSMSSSGVRSIADVINAERTNTSRIGGSSASFTGHFAYPNVSDYIKAGNKQETIYSISSASLSNSSTFRNSSWLGTGKSLWTMNGDNAALSYNYFWSLYYASTQSGNRIYGIRFNSNAAYQPVFYIKSDTILSGTGTSSDPFTVRENWDWFDNAQTLQ